jgi:hypothetical protein
MLDDQPPPQVFWISSMLALMPRTSSARLARVSTMATKSWYVGGVNPDGS